MSSKKGKRKNKNRKKIIIIIGVVIILLLVLAIILFNLRGNDIKIVKKILPNKYYEIKCIDTNCTSIVAKKGDSKKESTVYILNSNGKKVAKYKEIYNKNSKVTSEPYQVSDSYFIMKKTDNSTNEIIEYSVNDKKGKELYTTDNNIYIFNDDYLIVKNKNSDVYSLIDKNGKEKYSKITELQTYLDNKFLNIKINNEYLLLDRNLDKILDGYKIDKEVKDNDDTLYLILKSTEDNMYSYFDIKKMNTLGDSFSNYTMLENDTILITKKENGKEEKYILTKDGVQQKTDKYQTQIELVNKIKEKIDDKYYLYATSVTNKNQSKVLVDNKETSQFGVLNLDNNTFTALYDYDNKEKSNYSTINKLSSQKGTYYQITCNSSSCKDIKTLVYDADNAKVLYKNASNDLIMQNYVQYEDNYKVIKYSSSSTDSNYQNKYVLYNSENKEVFKSSNEILIIDKDILYGNVSDSSIILYLASEDKIINSDSSLAQLIDETDSKIYKYKNDNNETIILNEKAKEIFKTQSSNSLIYNSEYIIYLNNNEINAYSLKKEKTLKYKLNENEEINDSTNNIIPAYKGALFINNKADNYIKIVNFDGKKIKKIRKSQIFSVSQNEDTKNVFIITKKVKDSKNLYGLYLAK